MGDWLDGILGAVGDIGDDIVGFLTWLLEELASVLVFLYNLIAAIFKFFYTLAQAIGRFFESLWEGWLKGIFNDIWKAIQAAHEWLENLLAPIIRFLKTVLFWVNWVFQTYIKPFLTILQHIRSFLNLLRAFGIKWAAELDQILGKITADISQWVLKVNGYLNAIIGIVNSLADPLGLFRGPSFVMSMRRIFPGFVRGVTGLPLGYFFPGPGKGQPAGMGALPANFSAADPTMNPPPSTYFGYDDGLGDFGGVDPGDSIDPDDADDMQALAAFDQSLYPDPTYDNPSDAANAAWEQILGSQIVST